LRVAAEGSWQPIQPLLANPVTVCPHTTHPSNPALVLHPASAIISSFLIS
jgi:hypothetical protein